jgi:hypothetical protein
MIAPRCSVLTSWFACGVAALLLTAVDGVAGTTYYFSTSGNDGQDGLGPATAKKSLSSAAALMTPGNTVLFKRGDAWYSPTFELALANRAGTPTEPILVDAYGDGPKPIIACMELMDSGWTIAGSNRWTHPLTGYSDARRAFVDGKSRLKVASPAEVDNAHEFAVASSAITIFSTTTPTHVEVINNASLSVLRISNSSYLTFKNLEFRGGGRWVAIEVSPASAHVTFDSCDIREISMYGIQFNNSTSDYSLFHESPVIKNCVLDMGWTVEERTSTSYGGDGINFRNAVVNALVQGNRIIDFQHCGLTAELIDGANYVGVNNNIFEGNEVYLTSHGYIHGFGVQGIEGKATGNIFRRNYIHDVTNSAHVMGDRNLVYSNIFKNIDATVASSTVQPFAIDMLMFSYNGLTYVSKNNVVVNNTIYDTEGSNIRLSGAATLSENVFKNNLFVKWAPSTPQSDNYGFRNDGSGQPQIVENNCLWNFADGGMVIREGGTRYTAEGANAALSNYQGNIEADPLMVDPENGDFRLRAESPCRAAGQPITGLGAGFVDFTGAPWDPTHPSVGALQFGASPPASDAGTGTPDGGESDTDGDAGSASSDGGKPDPGKEDGGADGGTDAGGCGCGGVPEPKGGGALLLVGAGLLALWAGARRRPIRVRRTQ